MSDFNGINSFGSLTNKTTGTKINFDELKKFDENSNGKIEKNEFDKAIKELKLDSVSFTTIDSNKDETINQEEFNVWDQKTMMQEAANELLKEASQDATLNKYLSSLQKDLKEFIDDFAAKYTDDVSKMAADFKLAVADKFRELKEGVLANDPTTVKNQVLDEMFDLITQDSSSSRSEVAGTQNELTISLSDTKEAQILGKALEKEAEAFIKTYKGDNLKAVLETHLKEYFEDSDKQKVQQPINDFNATVQQFGGYISSDDFKQIKEAATKLLQAFVEKGVTVKLGNKNVASTAGITSALAQYTDPSDLLSAIQDAVNSLSDVPKKEALVEEAKAQIQAEAYKKFAGVKGAEYKIDASILDYTTIQGYFDNQEVNVKKQGQDGAKGTAIDTLNAGFKEQMKAQVQTMLAKHGLSFDQVANVFENVFNQSAQEAADECVDGKHSTFFRHSQSWFHTKDLVDNFLNKFNTNIEKAIDEMNASHTDFDKIDMDFTKLNEDENGKKIETANDDNFVESYQRGTVLTTRKHGEDYYEKIAEQIIDGLKSQMLTKAKNMCKANGVKFELSVFNTMFNNAKNMALNAAVSGVSADGVNFKGGAIAGGAFGATAGIGLTASGVATGGTILGSAIAVATGPIGWIGMGAAALGGFLATVIGSGHHSEASLDTKKLIDTFVDQMSSSFTAWVNGQTGATNTTTQTETQSEDKKEDEKK